MRTRTIIQILAGTAALLIGIATGLPFRSETERTPEQAKRVGQLRRAVETNSMKPEEEAIAILESSEPGTLKNALERGFKSSLV